MKFKVILFFIYSLLSLNIFTQDSKFLDSILLDEIERAYPKIEGRDQNYSITMHFDNNQYRIGEPIEMEIRIYARKGILSFTNSITHFDNYRIIAYDVNNKKVNESDNYVLWQSRDSYSSDNLKNRVITLKEGESYSFTVDLNDWLNFQSPGRYRVECAFNPISEISRDFIMKGDTSFFYLAEGNSKNIIRERAVKSIEKVDYATPSEKAPFEVVNDSLEGMKNRDWAQFFQNMHIPSLINISTRYYERYRENYNETIEDFSDVGLSQTSKRTDLDAFLKNQFSDTVSMQNIRSNFGNSYANNLNQSFGDNSVRLLSLRFELLYRTSMPEDKAKIFNEFKQYIASAYDRNVRIQFVAELEQKVATEKNQKDRDYYKQILSLIRSEYNPSLTFTLLNYKINRVIIEEKFGLYTATVETTLYERLFDYNTGNIYSPEVQRIFTLRRLGKYWYIVNYVDVATANNRVKRQEIE